MKNSLSFVRAPNTDLLTAVLTTLVSGFSQISTYFDDMTSILHLFVLSADNAGCS